MRQERLARCSPGVAGVNRTVAVHPPPAGTSPTQLVSTSVNAPWLGPPTRDVVDVQRGRAVVGEPEDLRCAGLVDGLVDERELLRVSRADGVGPPARTRRTPANRAAGAARRRPSPAWGPARARHGAGRAGAGRSVIVARFCRVTAAAAGWPTPADAERGGEQAVGRRQVAAAERAGAELVQRQWPPRPGRRGPARPPASPAGRSARRPSGPRGRRRRRARPPSRAPRATPVAAGHVLQHPRTAPPTRPRRARRSGGDGPSRERPPPAPRGAAAVPTPPGRARRPRTVGAGRRTPSPARSRPTGAAARRRRAGRRRPSAAPRRARRRAPPEQPQQPPVLRGVDGERRRPVLRPRRRTPPWGTCSR